MAKATWGFLVLMMLMPALVVAGDFLCGDDVVAPNRPALHRYTQTVDPTKVPNCPNPYPPVITIPEASIPAQSALYASVPNKKHLKVVSGLMVEMTQAEKDIVDKPDKDKKAAEDVAKAEITTNPICLNNTLQQITDYWTSKQAELQTTVTAMDSAIAATTGTTKTALTKIRDGLVAHMTMFIKDSELQWRTSCSGFYLASPQ